MLKATFGVGIPMMIVQVIMYLHGCHYQNHMSRRKVCERMTYKENITAILECYFTGFKKEIIDSACNRILEQQPKTGRWINTDEGFSPCKCSECKTVELKKSNYCPNCGCCMVEPQESEE